LIFTKSTLRKERELESTGAAGVKRNCIGHEQVGGCRSS
jgi:hypothetical protein